jgi:hypothetical protein
MIVLPGSNAGLCVRLIRDQRVVERIMKFKFLSGVALAVAATVVMPSALTAAWAGDAPAVASDGADHVGAGQVASDGLIA